MIFAGTTEGRTLSEILAASGIRHTVCVATEYGELVLKEHPLVQLHRGRMDAAQMRCFLEEGNFAAVVDATHPYAVCVTENIKKAVEDISALDTENPLPYYRLAREENEKQTYEKIQFFDCHETCARALQQINGNILLTTGSKELAKYASGEDLRERLYVRVLPGVESITLCMNQGICGKQIIALQGPFSAELNEALIRQYQIRCLVTKESGSAGGYEEKIEAARRADIPVFVIQRKKDGEGLAFASVCQKLSHVTGKEIRTAEKMDIVLAGIGMGDEKCLTKETADAIAAADILLGAPRMIAAYQPKFQKKPYYEAEQIVSYLKEIQRSKTGRKVVVLFSGDSGFYSGCGKLYQRLSEEIACGRLEAALSIKPGISSVSYLAACIGESYQDAAIMSIHGKENWQTPVIDAVRHHEKLYLLLSGASDVRALGQVLRDAGLGACRVTLGYQLSYPKQKLIELTPEECLGVEQEGLYLCFIKNLNARKRCLRHGIPDCAFIRGEVPMTKEEVREVSISKLRLREDAVVYDIGSGTGSVAVEIARLSPKIQVYAIERKENALSLIKANKKKFEVSNITVVQGEAPEQLAALPVPTHAFLGGSGRHMKEIIAALHEKNPRMHVVINAISVETICEIREVLAQYPVEEEEIVQLQASRAKKAGAYHLMQAENPVWICSFTFVPGQQKYEE